MSHQLLQGARILLVEDEAIIALDLQSILCDAGAIVVGPARTLVTAKQFVVHEKVDVALLDVQLGDQPVFSVAKLLRERNIPFAFHTGQSNAQLLPRDPVLQCPVIPKPASSRAIVSVLARLLVSGRDPNEASSA